MAEQVEITNVGNTGVASEVTLKLLLAAIERMAKSSGADSTATTSKVKSLRQEDLRSIINGTNETKENTKAVSENTEAVETATSRLNALGNMALNGVGSALGVLFRSTVGIGKEFFGTSNSLQAFSYHIPIVGNYLQGMTGYLEDSVQSLRALSGSGASFNNSLVELRVSAAESYMSLNDYTDMVRRNTERLSGFGGTVTQGTFQTRQLFKALGSTQQELMNIGLSFADINESLINYQYLNRAGSRAQQRDINAQAQAAAEYIKQLNTLAKLTGQDVKSMQEKLSAQQADVAFQMKLAQLRPEERDKVQQGLAEAMAMAGETGALYFKQQFLGMPPLTEATALFASTMGESADAIRRMQQEATNTGVSLEQFSAGSVSRLADFVEGSATAGARLEDVLAAASGGLEGPAAAISAIFQEQGKQFSNYLDENQQFNRDKFEQDVRAAQEELAARDNVTTAMNAFESTIASIKTNILAQFVESGVFEAAGKAITAFGNLLSAILTPERLENIRKFFDNITSALEGFGAAIANMSIDEIVVEGLKSIFAGIGDAIAYSWNNAPITTAIVAGLGAAFVALKSGLIGKLLGSVLGSGGTAAGAAAGGAGRGIGAGIAGLGKGIGVGTSSVLKGLATGIRAFANPATIAGLVPFAAGLGIVTLAVNGFALALRIAGPALEPFGNMIKSVFEGLKPVLEGFAEVLRGLGNGLESIFNGIAEAFRGFGEGILAIAGGISEVFIGFGEGFESIFNGIADSLRGFGDGVESILNGVSNVVTSIGTSITSVITGVSDSIGNVIAKITEYRTAGIEATTDQIERLSAIPGSNLEAAARGLEQMKVALEGFQPGFFDSLGAFFTGGAASEQMTATTANIENLAAAFSRMNPDQITAASTSVKLMGESLVSFATGLAANTGQSFIESIASWFGTGDNDSVIDKVINMSTAFSNLNGEAIIAGATGVSAIANSLQQFANSSIEDFEFNGNFVSQIERIADNAANINAAAQSLDTISRIQGIDTVITSFNSSLDFSSIDSYAASIENLKNVLVELNEVLASTNDTWMTERISSGELLQEVGSTNRLTSDKIEILNNTLLEILRIMNQNVEIDTKIERNTRSFGTDISRGIISNL